MVVGFTTTYAISAYYHWCCEFESRSGWGVQHYVIKFVSDLRQVGGFLRVLRFPPRHDITEILLKVTLNTIKQTNILTLYIFPWNKSSSLNSYVSQRRNNAAMAASMSFWLGHPFKCFWIIPRVKLKSETLWHA